MSAFIYILIGMGLAGGVGFFISRRNKAEQDRQRERDQTLSGAVARNDITRVGRDGVLRLPPFGGNPSPIETYVKKRHRYTDPNITWYELVCEHGNRDLLVEWYQQGGEVHVTAGFEDENPSLRDLGISEDDLINFDEAKAGEVRWDGITWRLKDVGERYYYENDKKDEEGYYAWDFVEESGGRWLSVEKWADDNKFYVYHLWEVDAGAIEVFEAGKL